MVNELKAYYIVSDNGVIDLIIGQEKDKKQVAVTTLDYIQKKNDVSWLKYRILEIDAEGIMIEGYINMVTTIKMNGQPIRTILNDFYNIPEIIEKYMEEENDYRHYEYISEYIKL